MTALEAHKESARDAALAYAAAGKPVFPLWGINNEGKCCCADPACKHPGKHPNGILAPKGKDSATTNPSTIESWFDRAAHSNVAMPTGEPTGVAVLDIDEAHGGYHSIDALERQYGDLPSAHAVMSGGGGLHVYFAYPTDQTISTSTGQVGVGLDIRAKGGSIVLPPSRHVSGRHYHWAEVTHEGKGPGHVFTPMPSWLLALAAKPVRKAGRYGSFPAHPLSSEVLGRNHNDCPISDGQRNATLASRAGSMRRAGCTESEILAALFQLNRDRCHPPLPDQEVERVAKSVARYAPPPEQLRVIGQTFRGFTVVDGKVVP